MEVAARAMQVMGGLRDEVDGVRDRSVGRNLND